jgi:cystathionine beta-lyase/cystathionine gamma-synthase
MNFATLTVHAGMEPDPTTGAVATPIYQTSTYVQEEPGKHKGYEYARTGNPTRTALETALAVLEGADYALCFGSGLAATDALLKMLLPGDEVVSCNDLYGGTYRLFTKVFAPLGIKFTFVPMSEGLEDFKAALSDRTRMVWIETPTNPLLNIVDIEAVTKIARARGIITVVDNTFATPYLQKPLKLGADVVVHSCTKYLGGHSDTVLGAVITSRPEVYERIKFLQNACGAVPGPMDCFLVLRGIRTLAVRMRQHCAGARQIAYFLREHPAVADVYYPGLADNPGHHAAEIQMRDYGGMVSFYTREDSVENAFAVMKRLKLFTLAESLGGVESLVGHPATMTHASIPREERLKNGLRDSLIRLSVGIEDPDDLIDDLRQALEG